MRVYVILENGKLFCSGNGREVFSTPGSAKASYTMNRPGRLQEDGQWAADRRKFKDRPEAECLEFKLDFSNAVKV